MYHWMAELPLGHIPSPGKEQKFSISNGDSSKSASEVSSTVSRKLGIMGRVGVTPRRCEPAVLGLVLHRQVGQTARSEVADRNWDQRHLYPRSPEPEDHLYLLRLVTEML